MTMPTARMEIILDLANQAVVKAETGRKLLEAINNDVNALRNEIDKLNIENEYIQDLMFSIANLSWDASKICTVPADLAQELGAERERLKLNANKNKNSRERMRRKRAREKENESGENDEQEQKITNAEISRRLEKIKHEEENKEQEQEEFASPNSLAARSEQIPLENDEESWLPKKK